MSDSPISVLFPGQGSQEPGMGRDLAEQDREAMNFWKKAEKISGLPLREIYWEGEAADMADTRALQPALTVVNCNLWRALSQKLEPACTAGHSLGEYSSLAAAGALTPDEALELVSLRGRLMAEADPEGRGTMAAILKLDREGAEEAVKRAAASVGGMLRIANYNTPGQFVASGERAAVAALQDTVKEARGRAMPLPVSGAFHSPLMQEAADELARVLRKTDFRDSRFPVYVNISGKPVQTGEELRQASINQMTASVYWIDTIRQQWQDGVRGFVECGPKGVLSRMVQPNLQGIKEDDQDVLVRQVGNAAELGAFAA